MSDYRDIKEFEGHTNIGFVQICWFLAGNEKMNHTYGETIKVLCMSDELKNLAFKLATTGYWIQDINGHSILTCYDVDKRKNDKETENEKPH